MSGRIVIMAGGTGGHVFPALAVAQELLAQGWQVSWLGTHSGLESRVVPAHGIEIDWLLVAGLRGKGILAKISAGFRFMAACLQAMKILRRRKPDVVLGMGGFVAAPGGLMAKCLSIPLVIHEQNRVPGTTNRLLVKFAATKVLEAFPGSFADAAQPIFTGNPLRADFLAMPDKTVWRQDCGRALRILVVGGSQGAKILNETVPDAVAAFNDVEIWHQTGSAMLDSVTNRYHALNVNAKATAFIDDMASAYAWADLLICRAGAMTVSEVMASGLPSIFVPLMHAIDDHQTANARYLSDANAAVLLPQLELSTTSLQQAIAQIIPNLEPMSKTVKTLARLDATQVVAAFCVAEASL